jgi:hypothetical protein
LAGPEVPEADALVSELESRLDRLRALYEQYFLGYEKMEPLTARKDIDRRFDVLRRMQFRNTGLRFRFQMLQQKYNTYQTYWLRTTRQIEAGTFKRHVQKAKKILQDKTVEREVDNETWDVELEVDEPVPAPKPNLIAPQPKVQPTATSATPSAAAGPEPLRPAARPAIRAVAPSPPRTPTAPAVAPKPLERPALKPMIQRVAKPADATAPAATAAPKPPAQAPAPAQASQEAKSAVPVAPAARPKIILKPAAKTLTPSKDKPE